MEVRFKELFRAQFFRTAEFLFQFYLAISHSRCTTSKTKFLKSKPLSLSILNESKTYSLLCIFIRLELGEPIEITKITISVMALSSHCGPGA